MFLPEWRSTDDALKPRPTTVKLGAACPAQVRVVYAHATSLARTHHLLYSIDRMQMVVNIYCPRCGTTLLADGEVGYCPLCSRRWEIAGDMIVEAATVGNLSDVEKSRQLAENISDVVASHNVHDAIAED